MQISPRLLLGVIGAVAVALGLVVWSGTRRAVVQEVRVPDLSAAALAGQKTYGARCAACHGEHAGGGAKGPPLVHRTYRPAHHADISFELAVKRGVRAHHWGFGDMPALPDVTREEVHQITQYVRELQRANGID
jgi:mono/diheme cytochrome c family protein